MFFFKKKFQWMRGEMDLMEGKVKESFERVRQDHDLLKAWINYYHQKNAQLEKHLKSIHAGQSGLKSELSEASRSHATLIGKLLSRIEQLDQKVSLMPEHTVKHDELKFHIENISKELKKMESKVEQYSYLPVQIHTLKEQFMEHISQPHTTTQIEKKVEEMQAKLQSLIIKKSPREKLVQKVTKNRHDYIRAMILSYVQKYQKISGLQLREMMVEEQNMTSKSTFYRILDEIEHNDDIGVIREGKEKIYISKLKKTS